MNGKSPYEGREGFKMRSIGTRDDRAKLIAEMISQEAETYAKRTDQIRNVLTDAMTQLIAECTATAFGGGDDDAADVGWALAEAITYRCAVNAHLVQLAGDIADLYVTEHERVEADL